MVRKFEFDVHSTICIQYIKLVGQFYCCDNFGKWRPIFIVFVVKFKY